MENFTKANFRIATGVSRETLSKLPAYVDLLQKWQGQMNLVSPKSLREVWSRHLYDSAQLFSYIQNENSGVLDLGSGAGFPGLVLSIMGAKNVVLIESSQKKCSFLREVIRVTASDAEVFAGRVEEYPDAGPSCFITARALAPLDSLLALSYPLLSEGSRCLFLKGKNHMRELMEVSENIRTRFEIYDSLSNEEGKVLFYKSEKNFL